MRLSTVLSSLALLVALAALLAAAHGACDASYAAFGQGNAWCVLR